MKLFSWILIASFFKLKHAFSFSFFLPIRYFLKLYVLGGFLMLQWDLMCHIHCVIVAAEANWLQIKHNMLFSSLVTQWFSHPASATTTSIDSVFMPQRMCWCNTCSKGDGFNCEMPQGDAAAADDSDRAPEAKSGCTVSWSSSKSERCHATMNVTNCHHCSNRVNK